MSDSNTQAAYKVLSPWAEVEPILQMGLTARLTELAEKKIGLFHMWKRSSKPMLTVIERKLKERFPTIELSW